MIKQHLDLMERGLIERTTPWPSTGWEDVIVMLYPKELKLWVGVPGMKELGIVKVVKGETDG